jgi:hypothetical protein
MAPFPSHIFVVNYDGKGVMLIFRLQQLISNQRKKLNHMK